MRFVQFVVSISEFGVNPYRGPAAGRHRHGLPRDATATCGIRGPPGPGPGRLLERGFTPLAGADADHIGDLADEDFAVAAAPGAHRADQGMLS